MIPPFLKQTPYFTKPFLFIWVKSEPLPPPRQKFDAIQSTIVFKKNLKRQAMANVGQGVRIDKLKPNIFMFFCARTRFLWL